MRLARTWAPHRLAGRHFPHPHRPSPLPLCFLGPAHERGGVPRAGFHGTALARQRSLYDVLGVPKTATPKEIKIAYFKAAKRYHPDMNPGDERAKANFQKVADAYEVLGSDAKRAAYDREPHAYEQHRAEGYGQEKHYRSAQDTWDDAVSDQTIFQEAMSEFATELQEDVSDVATAVNIGDFSKLWDFVHRRKGIVIGVVLPIFAILRFPGPVLVALRGLPIAIFWAHHILHRLGLSRVAFAWVWRMAVQAARASRDATRRRRRQQRRK